MSLFTACNLVGRASGLNFQKSDTDNLYLLCQYSNIVPRQVRLDGNWWKREGLPLLGFTRTRPVALLWKKNRYVCMDPEASLQEILPIAYTFYAALPEKASLLDVVPISLQGNGSTILQLLTLGSLGALIGLFSPFIYQLLFDRVIPDADWSLLLQILAGLIVVATSSFLFQLVRSFLLLRLEGIVQNRLDTAIWDRIFKAPLSFFRRFATGDLIQRTAVLDRARELLGGSFLQLVVSTFLSLFYLIPMFYFSWQLSLVGLTILALSFLLSVAFLLYRNRMQRLFLELGARMNQFLLQLVGGIDKIRIAGAEERAFNHWNSLFTTSQKLGYAYGKVQNRVTLLSTLLSAISIFSIYITVFWILKSGQPMTIGTFMAFNAAFTPLSQAISSLLSAFISFIALIPAWERGRVILDERPEVTQQQKKEVTGKIQLQNVSFGYEEEPLLRNISLEIKPGEWLGIVGPSGRGKSTLLRLLLGFEKPTEGTIYYDGTDLRDLDARYLRMQLGVVLQTSRISAGTIYDNIVYGRRATPENIKRAITGSCFDEVLAELPLGLDTPLPTGGGTLSGGQVQRLLLARALVLEPKIMLLDEATSTLDGPLQEKIMQNLSHLRVTRIVVAHRVDTLQGADAILEL